MRTTTSAINIRPIFFAHWSICLSVSFMLFVIVKQEKLDLGARLTSFQAAIWDYYTVLFQDHTLIDNIDFLGQEAISPRVNNRREIIQLHIAHRNILAKGKWQVHDQMTHTTYQYSQYYVTNCSTLVASTLIIEDKQFNRRHQQWSFI